MQVPSALRICIIGMFKNSSKGLCCKKKIPANATAENSYQEEIAHSPLPLSKIK